MKVEKVDGKEGEQGGNGQVGNKGSSRKQQGRERGGVQIIGKGGQGGRIPKPRGEVVKHGWI